METTIGEIDEIFREPPHQAIQLLEQKLKTTDKPNNKALLPSPNEEQILLQEELTRLVKKYNSVLHDAAKAKEIQSLQSLTLNSNNNNENIDINRFATDDSYKREVILSLAQTKQSSQLAKAIEMSEQYGLPSRYELIIHHVQWLFQHSNGTGTEELNALIKSHELTVLQQPSSSIQSLQPIEPTVSYLLVDII